MKTLLLGLLLFFERFGAKGTRLSGDHTKFCVWFVRIGCVSLSKWRRISQSALVFFFEPCCPEAKALKVCANKRVAISIARIYFRSLQDFFLHQCIDGSKNRNEHRTGKNSRSPGADQGFWSGGRALSSKFAHNCLKTG